MEKHKDCEHECQQAVEYGVWPEHSCSPRCVWLDRKCQDCEGTGARDSNGNFTGPDAALIAAAPELLAAAIKVNALSIQSEAHKELRLAIAKATKHDA